MEAQEAAKVVTRKFKTIAYVTDWFAYVGALFTKLSKIGDVIRDNFNDLHIPKKENYYE
jgi:hypothetical protein